MIDPAQAGHPGVRGHRVQPPAATGHEPATVGATSCRRSSTSVPPTTTTTTTSSTATSASDWPPARERTRSEAAATSETVYQVRLRHFFSGACFQKPNQCQKAVLLK